MIFLRERSSPAASSDEEENSLPDNTVSVSRAGCFSVFFPSLVPVDGCLWGRAVDKSKVFGWNTLRRRKIASETALPLDLAFLKSCTPIFVSGWREQVTERMDLSG